MAQARGTKAGGKEATAKSKSASRGKSGTVTVRRAESECPWWASATGAWADTESRTYADLTREERVRVRREAPELYNWLRGSKKRKVLEIRMRPRRRKDVSVRFLMARHDTPEVETLPVVFADPAHTTPPKKYQTYQVEVG